MQTPGCLIGRLGPWGSFETGELSLADGVVAFTSDTRGLVFQAPVSDVKLRFPTLYFGLGTKLRVDGKTYRVWFLPLESARGSTTMDKETIVAGNEFNLSDVGPARAASRQWRAALSELVR